MLIWPGMHSCRVMSPGSEENVQGECNRSRIHNLKSVLVYSLKQGKIPEVNF